MGGRLGWPPSLVSHRVERRKRGPTYLLEGPRHDLQASQRPISFQLLPRTVARRTSNSDSRGPNHFAGTNLLTEYNAFCKSPLLKSSGTVSFVR